MQAIILIIGVVIIIFGIVHLRIKALEEENERLRNMPAPEPLLETVPLSTYNDLLDNYKHYQKETNELISRVQIECEQLKEKISAEVSKQRSEQVRIGLISENLIPFLNGFEYEPRNLVAIFKPIDFVMFGEDKIVFIEVKTGNSKMSPKQKNIKKLIEEGKVYFESHRLNENGYSVDKGEK